LNGGQSGNRSWAHEPEQTRENGEVQTECKLVEIPRREWEKPSKGTREARSGFNESTQHDGSYYLSRKKRDLVLPILRGHQLWVFPELGNVSTQAKKQTALNRSPQTGATEAKKRFTPSKTGKKKRGKSGHSTDQLKTKKGSRNPLEVEVEKKGGRKKRFLGRTEAPLERSKVAVHSGMEKGHCI